MDCVMMMKSLASLIVLSLCIRATSSFAPNLSSQIHRRIPNKRRNEVSWWWLWNPAAPTQHHSPFQAFAHEHDHPTSLESPLLIYNSLTRQKEVFQPKDGSHGGVVSMYTCGPTVYDSAHLGNFRAFLTYDLLKRVLLYLGYDVRHICNITDIDDKILKRANERDIAIGSIHTLTETYEQAFMDDLKSLNCLPATAYPRATEHVPVMIRFVQDLAHKGLAYETADGSWYFETQKQPQYGQQLVQLNYDEMMEQKETENADGKHHFADFCLWKAFKPESDRRDAAWDSDMFPSKHDDTVDRSSRLLEEPDVCKTNQPWPLAEPVLQLGRPGWHLECSAMARTYFGETTTLDFHGGGVDLKFPHHENEIAQSQGLMDQSFCNCWFHNGFVNMEKEKMSKSLGNFVTVADACPTSLDKRAYRYLVISSQYRNQLQFTKAAMDASKKAIKRMDKLLQAIESLPGDEASPTTANSKLAEVDVPKALHDFEIAIRDDLSMPRASAALFSIIKAAEQELKRANKDNSHLDIQGLKAAENAIRKMDQIFGVFYSIDANDDSLTDNEEVVPENVMKLVFERAQAKESKDWELADSLRQRVSELGYTIKDVKDGDPVVTPLEV